MDQANDVSVEASRQQEALAAAEQGEAGLQVRPQAAQAKAVPAELQTEREVAHAPVSPEEEEAQPAETQAQDQQAQLSGAEKEEEEEEEEEEEVLKARSQAPEVHTAVEDEAVALPAEKVRLRLAVCRAPDHQRYRFSPRQAHMLIRLKTGRWYGKRSDLAAAAVPLSIHH